MNNTNVDAEYYTDDRKRTWLHYSHILVKLSSIASAVSMSSHLQTLAAYHAHKLVDAVHWYYDEPVVLFLWATSFRSLLPSTDNLYQVWVKICAIRWSHSQVDGRSTCIVGGSIGALSTDVRPCLLGSSFCSEGRIPAGKYQQKQLCLCLRSGEQCNRGCQEGEVISHAWGSSRKWSRSSHSRGMLVLSNHSHMCDRRSLNMSLKRNSFALPNLEKLLHQRSGTFNARFSRGCPFWWWLVDQHIETARDSYFYCLLW